MIGIGVNSRNRAEAGMKGLKLAASGFPGLNPTMSGVSLGGLRGSIVIGVLSFIA